MYEKKKGMKTMTQASPKLQVYTIEKKRKKKISFINKVHPYNVKATSKRTVDVKSMFIGLIEHYFHRFSKESLLFSSIYLTNLSSYSRAVLISTGSME